MNQYTWKINALDAKVHENDKDYVIYNIHWSYLAVDEQDDKYQAMSNGCLAMQYNPDEPFIEYADLTKEDVIGWLESGLEVDEIKANLDKQIELQKNPVDETLYPNWE